ncbi:MAG: hypothetical protein RL338_1942 [Chloroflexota bacterium]
MTIGTRRLLEDGAVARAVLEVGDQAILLADDERRYVDASPAACELLGRTREEILALRVDDLAPEPARPWVADAWARFREEGAQAGTMVIARPDGTVRHAAFTARAGVAPGVHLSVLTDVTELVESRDELLRANERLERSLDIAARASGPVDDEIPTVVWTQDESLRYTFVSNFRFGLTAADLIGRTDEEVWPEAAPTLTARKREVLATGRRADVELELVYPSGPRRILVSLAPLLDPGGRPVGILGANTNVTAIRAAEEAARRDAAELETLVAARTAALTASEARFRELVSGLDAVVWEQRPDGTFYVAPQAERILGWPAATHGPAWWEAHVAEEGARRAEVIARLTSPASEIVTFRWRRGDGSIIWLREHKSAFLDGSGQVLRRGVTLDVTAEMAGRERFTRAVEALLDPFAILRPLRDDAGAVADLAVEYLNPAALAALPDLDRVAERRHLSIWPDDAIDGTFELFRDACGGQPFAGERRLVRGGATFWIDMRIAPLPDGTVSYTWRDTTALREAAARRDAAVRASEARFRALIETQDAYFWDEDEATQTPLYLSPQVERLFGYPPSHFVGVSRSWRRIVHPADRRRVARVFDSGREEPTEFRVIRADGSIAWVREQAVSFRDETGAGRRRIGVGMDITASRAAAEERFAAAERLAELVRLESVARISATTAHDFGNTLVGIDVFARALEAEPGLSERAQGDIARIRAAVAAGQVGVQALVALGQRRPGSATPIRIDEAVGALASSARGILGDGIELALDLHAGPAVVELDPGALDRGLVNLLANARDAIPGTGRVLISTRVVTEDPATPTAVGIPAGGRYVRVEVTDDGLGMEPVVASRIFEPYFTTKPTGKGTGLGLSSVHALVRAVEGHIHLATAPGRGSSFGLCLPARPASRRPRRPARRSTDPVA